MPASSDFLVWAIGPAPNVDPQSAYAGGQYLATGNLASIIVPVTTLNKAMRQATFVAASVAQWAADNLQAYVADDGVIANLEGQIRSAITYAAGVRAFSFTGSGFDHLASVPKTLHGPMGQAILSPITGTYNWNWPTTAGTASQPLKSAGGGSSPMTWAAVTGTGPYVVMQASPTWSGTPIVPSQRTSSAQPNGGSNLTINTWYTAIPAASIPAGLSAVFARHMNPSPDDSAGCMIMNDGNGSLSIRSRMEIPQGANYGTIFQFDGSGDLQIQNTESAGAATSPYTVYWTNLCR